MSFTDEEKALWYSASKAPRTAHLKLRPDRFLALLARLEAAEILHAYVDHKPDCHLRKETGSYCDCNLPIFQNRYRKAVGK